LQQKGMQHVSVLGVESVEVDAETLSQYGDLRGCKGRVIALAFRLRELLPRSGSSATCVADRDMDDLLGRSWQCNLLFFTDFTSMEMYFFDEKSLGKFFDLQLLGFPQSPAAAIAAISDLLARLFLYRAANEVLGWDMTRPDWRRCADVTKGRVKFDAEEFVRRYLNGNKRAKQAKLFYDTVDAVRTRMAEDPRQRTHGHDLIEVLTWYCHKLKRAANFKEEHVQRGLMATADAGSLSGFPLFQILLERLQPEKLHPSPEE